MGWWGGAAEESTSEKLHRGEPGGKLFLFGRARGCFRWRFYVMRYWFWWRAVWSKWSFHREFSLSPFTGDTVGSECF